jgi:hypothetical protein
MTSSDSDWNATRARGPQAQVGAAPPGNRQQHRDEPRGKPAQRPKAADGASPSHATV